MVGREEGQIIHKITSLKMDESAGEKACRSGSDGREEPPPDQNQEKAEIPDSFRICLRTEEDEEPEEDARGAEEAPEEAGVEALFADLTASAGGSVWVKVRVPVQPDWEFSSSRAEREVRSIFG